MSAKDEQRRTARKINVASLQSFSIRLATTNTTLTSSMRHPKHSVFWRNSLIFNTRYVMMQKSDEVRSKSCHNKLKLSKKNKVFFSDRLSLGFPLEFRYISVLSPMILRSFFDQSSIDLRFPNGEWTENERRMNENRSKNDREPIENRTRT